MTAIDFFLARLEHETDASDLYAAREAGEEIRVVDVRSGEAWRQGHVVGATHLPYRDIATATAEWDRSIPVVVYCWSPGCNAGVKGAIEFARAGFQVKEMIGGYEYWAREGYPVEDENGALPRTRDPLVAIARSEP